MFNKHTLKKSHFFLSHDLLLEELMGEFNKH